MESKSQRGDELIRGLTDVFIKVCQMIPKLLFSNFSDIYVCFFNDMECKSESSLMLM